MKINVNSTGGPRVQQPTVQPHPEIAKAEGQASQPATTTRLAEEQIQQRTGFGNTAQAANFQHNEQAGQVTKQQTGLLKLLQDKDAEPREWGRLVAGPSRDLTPAEEAVRDSLPPISDDEADHRARMKEMQAPIFAEIEAANISDELSAAMEGAGTDEERPYKALGKAGDKSFEDVAQTYQDRTGRNRALM